MRSAAAHGNQPFAEKNLGAAVSLRCRIRGAYPAPILKVVAVLYQLVSSGDSTPGEFYKRTHV